MRITNEFNRLYHGAFLGDLYKQMMHKKCLAMTFDKFKQALKYHNKGYPRYENTNNLVSTTDIRSGDLVNHIEWVRWYAGNYGFVLTIDDEAYRRMMELAHAQGI